MFRSCPQSFSSTFNSWNDYLGLSSLIFRGLTPPKAQGEPESPPCEWSLLLPAPVEPSPEQQTPSQGKRGCAFCRNNRESAAFYSTHRLRGPDGRVQCPVLRSYTCPLCGANGDQAHTTRYCPMRLQGGNTRAGHLLAWTGHC
ncbi:nanos homolog 1 [Discoglossus pictus]